MDVYHTLAHGVALVRILNAGLKCAARGSLQILDAKIAISNFGPLTAEIGSEVWGTPTNFNGFCVFAALLHGRAGNGSMGHGSWVKWVTKIGWVTWVIGVDP